jgi:hypothetical protein
MGLPVEPRFADTSELAAVFGISRPTAANVHVGACDSIFGRVEKNPLRGQ